MSTMADAPETPAESVDDRPLPPSDADQVAQITNGSTYLHYGPGAAECPDRGERVDGEWVGDGKCDNPEHYHAFLRVLNPFHTNEVYQRALAARARRKALIETEGTDPNVIFEAGIAEVRQAAEQGGDQILRDELVGMHQFVDQIEAWGIVMEKPEWETINADREKLREFDEEAEENPDAPISEEHQMLRDRVKAFYDDLMAEQRAQTAPRYVELEGLSIDDLMARVREVRLETETLAEFTHVRAWAEWFHGTYRTTRNEKGQHRTRMYPSEEALKEEETEIIAELQIAFQQLKEPTARRAEGNS